MQSDDPLSPSATPEELEEHQAFERMLELFALNNLPVPNDARQAFRVAQVQRAARPRIRSLDAKTLRSISPQDLDAILYEYVSEWLSTAGDRTQELSKLPRGVQVFYLTFIVEAEVANGGFHQFFWSSSSEFADLVASAITELGDLDAARIYEQAFNLARSEAGRCVEKASELLEAFASSASRSKLSQFDEPFAQHARHFASLRVALVREREQLFLV